MNAVGDFLAMAAWLIEIKSQQVLPRSDEVEEELEDPRQELVRAAVGIQTVSRRGQHVGRVRPGLAAATIPGSPSTCPAASGTWPRNRSTKWSFGTWSALSDGSCATAWRPSPRTSSTTIRRSTSTWSASMPGWCSGGNWPSATCFDAGLHKSAMIGIFLAVLELVRHHRVRVEQNELFGEIWLLPDANCCQPLDLSNVDNYETRQGSG